MGPEEPCQYPESLGDDQRSAVYYEFWHPDGAGAGQQLRYGHHGGLCGSGEDRFLCLYAGAGFWQRLLDLCGPELRGRPAGPHQKRNPQCRADKRGVLHRHQRAGLRLCRPAYGDFHRPGSDRDHCGGRAVPPHRGRVLHRHWPALSALRLLPGGQPAGDVGHPDHCFPWHPCGAGLSAFCHAAGCYRHLAQCAHRLGAGRCHRHWVLFEEECLQK